MCVRISKDIGIDKEKEICVPNKEPISGHRCERTNKAAKYMPKKECLRDHRCESRNMTYKCKILEPVNLTPHGHCTHVYSFQSYWQKYRNQNMTAKQGISKAFLDDKEEMWLPDA